LKILFVLTATAIVALPGNAQAQPAQVTIEKTEKIGNWTAASLSAKEPSILVTLPSDDRKALFGIQCLTNLRRWSILFAVPGNQFFERGSFELILKEPRGSTAALKLHRQGPDTLYAFFDRDESAVFQAIRWFTIFDSVDVTIKQQFPDPDLSFRFETTGAKQATAIPVARCGKK